MIYNDDYYTLPQFVILWLKHKHFNLEKITIFDMSGLVLLYFFTLIKNQEFRPGFLDISMYIVYLS